MGCVCWFAALFLQTLKQPGGARQPCLSWEGRSTTQPDPFIIPRGGKSSAPSASLLQGMALLAGHRLPAVPILRDTGILVSTHLPSVSYHQVCF